MSARLMGQVWYLDIEHELAWVLMAYVDHADQDGRGIKVGYRMIAYKTGYSVRQVQRLTARLVARGLLEVMEQGIGRGKFTEYAAHLERGARKRSPEIWTSCHLFTENTTKTAVKQDKKVTFSAENIPAPERTGTEPLTVKPLTVYINTREGEKEKWDRVKSELSRRMLRVVWQGSVAHTEFVKREGQTLVVSAPSWGLEVLRARWRPLIEQVAAGVYGEPMQVTFVDVKEATDGG